jgi:hypothetical protein
MQKKLTEDTITFGKYKDLSLAKLLRDRKYCVWLLQQDWFQKQYEYLYNRVKNYSPKNFFVTENKIENNIENFVDNYQYFNLCPPDKLEIELTQDEKTCYKFYLETIESLKAQIGENDNPFDIKAPTSWLKKFEKNSGLSRDIFKEFLNAYELPNITSIVEDIKKMGGISYKGAKSFLIAKNKSLKQEHFWENVLKKFYGEDIGSQYKYKNCFFDFINIPTNTLYECKLGIKDFNIDQHNKYLLTLGTFSLVYLIGTDCIIDLQKKTVFALDPDEYQIYLATLKERGKFDELISNFIFQKINCIEDYFAPNVSSPVTKQYKNPSSSFSSR